MSDVLDIPAGIGQVASEIRWMVLSRQLETIGEVKPVYPTAISNDTSANILRSLRGLTLRQNDMRDVNPNTDRLMPVWEFENGSRRPGFTGWPCGVFMFGSRVRERGSLHTMHNATLMDQGYQLDQELSESFGLASHSSVYPAMGDVIYEAGIVRFEIDSTEQTVKDPINWQIGTSGLQVLRDLAQIAGFLTPYFDNTGTLILRAPTEMTELDAHIYDLDTESGRVVQGSIRENDQLLDAPNIYTVVSTGPTQVEIVARARIDPRLPHSEENIGYPRNKTIRMQGLEDSGHAQRIANAYAAADVSQFQVVEFDSAHDPRHDTFDVLRYDGVLYRELRSTLALQPGGTHSHFATRNPYIDLEAVA